MMLARVLSSAKTSWDALPNPGEHCQAREWQCGMVKTYPEEGEKFSVSKGVGLGTEPDIRMMREPESKNRYDQREQPRGFIAWLKAWFIAQA
jgi:hypothetical protein